MFKSVPPLPAPSYMSSWQDITLTNYIWPVQCTEWYWADHFREVNRGKVGVKGELLISPHKSDVRGGEGSGKFSVQLNSMNNWKYVKR